MHTVCCNMKTLAVYILYQRHLKTKYQLFMIFFFNAIFSKSILVGNKYKICKRNNLILNKMEYIPQIHDRNIPHNSSELTNGNNNNEKQQKNY